MDTMENLAGFPLWDFSLGIYGWPGVSAAAIALQDESGLDVNLLLLCLWCGVEGPGVVDGATLGRCRNAVADWQRTVVLPLRELRRRLKTQTGDLAELRDRLAAAELAAEHAEQRLLSALISGTGSPRRLEERSAVVADNLRAYLVSAGVPASAIVDERLRVLVNAIASLP